MAPRREILEYLAGRDAHRAGASRDGRRNVHWLNGWDQEHAERGEAKRQPSPESADA